MTPAAAHHDATRLAALVIAVAAAYYLIARLAGLELHYDEAQYWEWAQHLDWSYYSKGPLIAWLIAASTALFGDGEWQVRIFGWIIHGLFLAVMYGLARDVTESRAGAWWAVLLALTTPLYFVLGIVMTTDSLMLLFWALGLWAIYRALFRGRRHAWYGAGMAVGVGALAKLSIGLLPAFVGIAMLLDRDLRRHLGDPHLWGGVVLLFACMSPMLIWNANHGYVMFLHELGHVDSSEPALDTAAEFVAGQFMALSPLVVALAVVVLRRIPATPAQRLLWMLSIAWFGFFLLKSLGGKVQANWAAMTYVSGMVLLAGAIPALTRAQRALLYGGVGASLPLIAVFLFPGLISLHPSEFAPVKKLKGWRDPLAQVARAAGPVDFILTDDYTTAAVAAFYWPTRLPVYVMGNTERRHNQHDLWPGVEREAGRTAVIVQTGREHLPEIARGAFDACDALAPVEVRDDAGVLRTFYAFRCVNYRPIEWPTPRRY